MSLFDPESCPHTCDVYSSATTTDSGGGSQSVFTLEQSAVPCWAPTVSGGETERFSQTQQLVQHTICARADSFTTTPERGWKLVVSGVSLRITGVNVNQSPSDTIPALIEVKAESWN